MTRILASSFVCLSASALALAMACTAPSGGEGGGDSGDGSDSGDGGGLDSGDGGGLDSGDGGGLDSGLDGGADGGGDGGCGSSLAVLYRDFKGSNEAGGHPDFEISATRNDLDGKPFKGWNDIGCGLVEPTLGNDSKPIFFGGPGETNGGVTVPAGSGRLKRVVSGPGCWTEQNPNPGPEAICNIGTCAVWDFAPPVELSGAFQFNQWFNTIEGVNMEVPSTLTLEENPPGSGIRVFDSSAFFPIDGQGFGNTPGLAHNYHFTTEIHVTFQYEAGQRFTFRGDDDLWIFVNGRLALDVGGRHQALTGTIDFDLQATELGITPGSTYSMDIFHAERQSDQSNFRIETNIQCFTPVPR